MVSGIWFSIRFRLEGGRFFFFKVTLSMIVKRGKINDWIDKQNHREVCRFKGKSSYDVFIKTMK